MSVYQLGSLRVVDLTKTLDPKTESRRCHMYRFNTGGPIPDFHTIMDLTSHLGTHVECPYHHSDDWHDVQQLPLTTFMGRCVYLKFEDLAPNAHIGAADLDRISRGRVREDDIVILDSNHPYPPFTPGTNSPDDKRLFINRESAEWFKKMGVKCVGFGDGVSIENCYEDVCAFHDVLMEVDCVFLEVLKNLDELTSDVFFFSYAPLPIKGLDSCPVRAYAIDGLPGYTE